MPKRARHQRPPRLAASRLVRGRLAAAATLVVALPIAAVVAWLMLSESSEADGPRAAIVDQLSLTSPNPAFAEEATATLTQAGYDVDYYSGNEVNVGFYRSLPSLDYDILVLRVHSDRLVGEWEGQPLDEAVLFSNEPFDEQKYLDDRANARLTSARYEEDSTELLFGISPDFVEDRMEGSFDGALVIAMGCEGLVSPRTAQAFVNKGASAYIGWDELVSSSHTDTATERLLQHIAGDGLPPADAVERTMTDVGPDPQYDSKLVVYEAEAALAPVP